MKYLQKLILGLLSCGQKQRTYSSGRFTITTGITEGCVTDTQTKLMWSKDANLWGYMTWQQALDKITWLNQNGGLCGWTDWRLPSIKELRSLVDIQNYNPSLPTGHPFSNIALFYWSSTTIAGITTAAWVFGMQRHGAMTFGSKTSYNYVWPVRSGQ